MTAHLHLFACKDGCRIARQRDESPGSCRNHDQPYVKVTTVERRPEESDLGYQLRTLTHKAKA